MCGMSKVQLPLVLHDDKIVNWLKVQLVLLYF